MADKLLETLEIEPHGPARAAVIWLHGLGADGHDFQPIVPELSLPEEARIRFVFPHAPYRPVTINGGMSLRAWYDLLGLEAGSPQDVAGIQDGERRLRELIGREISRGVPAARIVLAGFSQGGALALYAGLRYPERLAGIMGLSTYLPLHQSLAEAHLEGNAKTPVFMVHGRQDPVLPFEFGVHARHWLQERGYPVEWREYAMGHQVCREEIQAIAAWLQQVLGEPPH